MKYEELKQAVKKYCEHEKEDVMKRGADKDKAIDRSYGAVMFVLNYCDHWDSELANWWGEFWWGR